MLVLGDKSMRSLLEVEANWQAQPRPLDSLGLSARQPDVCNATIRSLSGF
jgi:hypothetical protein